MIDEFWCKRRPAVVVVVVVVVSYLCWWVRYGTTGDRDVQRGRVYVSGNRGLTALEPLAKT